jgi:HSP20 family protein
VSDARKPEFQFLSSNQYCVFWHRGCSGPALNIYETEQYVLIVAELAGVAAETLHLDVGTNVVHIAGQRTVTSPANLVRIHRLEIATGSFHFEIRLNVDVDPEKASSHYQHGLLEITLPLVQQAHQPIVIDVKEGELA